MSLQAGYDIILPYRQAYLTDRDNTLTRQSVYNTVSFLVYLVPMYCYYVMNSLGFYSTFHLGREPIY
jgi:hypothetical protein